MVGGGTLGTRTRVIGEWSDIGALFNACDVVCSSATTDVARLALAMSMLCGVMCVATGMGAQGEVIGNFGVAVEPGSPDAMAKGIRRILEMPADRHAFMSREARKHAWQNFNITRSIDRYHELYIELATGEAVKLAADKPDPIPDAPIIARPTPAAVAAKPVEEAPAIPQPVIVAQEPIAPAKPDTLTADLDAMLAKQGDALAKAPDSALKHSAQENVMDWSEDDAKLIEGVMVEADTTMMKALDVRAMPVPKPSESKAAAEAKLAAAKSAEQKASEQKLLAARRAELQRAESNMMRAATPVKPVTPAAPKPVSSAPPATPRVETKPEAKPIELKLVETKPVESKSVGIKAAEIKLADVKPADVKSIETKAESLSLESEPREAKLAEVKAAEFKPAEAKPAEAKVEPKAIEPILELVSELKIESASAEVRPVDAKLSAPATPESSPPEPRTLELELVVPDEPLAAVQLNSAARS
jgi:hypothetical protein